MTSTQCPDWCTHHNYRRDVIDDEFHQMRVRDDVGATIIVTQSADEAEPVLYVEVDGQDTTSAEARKIADLLTMAAEVMDQIAD